MTDNEIIKALECCMRGFCFRDGCPFADDIADGEINICTSKLSENALDLINRQKAEVEELKLGAGLRNNRKYYKKFVKEVFQKEIGNDLTYPDFDYIYQLYFEQKAEIERLNNTFILARGSGKSVIQLRIDKIKAEAIKEFAERLKAETKGLIGANFIDNIAKEMVGDV